jgi:hypothetical protein
VPPASPATSTTYHVVLASRGAGSACSQACGVTIATRPPGSNAPALTRCSCFIHKDRGCPGSLALERPRLQRYGATTT